ncbi:methyltransferase domain-containing protein [Streptomyces yangpuensis]|uniref:methyltransferase domain-containing protein n=1 Tax=Streptomyces yangpuensis TaxID=1648182 RepID=UPI003668154A
MTAFVSAASAYARYRPQYPMALFAGLAEHVGLNGTQTALDLGCGPGTLTLPLAALAAHVHAVDLEPAMLAEGRALAAADGIENITWTASDAAELLDLQLPPLDLCVMGKSFQWMNQAQLLTDLDRLVTPTGTVVLISTAARSTETRPDWLDVIERTCVTFLGPDYLQANNPVAHPAEGRDEVLRASPFSTLHTKTWEQRLTRTLDELVGLQLSFAHTNPAVLGDRQPAFERALREALTAHNPTGAYKSVVPIEAVFATRP